MKCFRDSCNTLTCEDNRETLIVVSGQIEVGKAYDLGD